MCRTTFITAVIAISMNAQAVSAAPVLARSDDAHLIRAKMSHTMTCGEMMQMHRKMMGGKKMTCSEMMRMHRKMMSGHDHA